MHEELLQPVLMQVEATQRGRGTDGESVCVCLREREGGDVCLYCAHVCVCVVKQHLVVVLIWSQVGLNTHTCTETLSVPGDEVWRETDASLTREV